MDSSGGVVLDMECLEKLLLSIPLNGFARKAEVEAVFGKLLLSIPLNGFTSLD